MWFLKSMTKSYVMVNLDDPRTARIAEVMGNKTCKRILALLGEHELSESELAQRLAAPTNTVNYNVKKLVGSGLIEPSRSFWSVKGRAVRTYRLSQKDIVISPKTFTRGLLPAFVISGAVALGLKILGGAQQSMSSLADGVSAGEKTAVATVASESAKTSSDYLYYALASAPDSWAIFLIGALFALSVLLLWNWFRS